MSRELAKTYDPKGIEDRLYEKWLRKKYFHAEVDHRAAAYGPCAGQYHAGYSDPLQEDAGL